MAHSFRLHVRFPSLLVSMHACLPSLGLLWLLLCGMSFVVSTRPQGRLPAPLGFYSVFGQDLRQEVALDNSPLQAVGRIELQAEGVIPWLNTAGVPICTATLVSIDLVLTNAHCVFDHGSENVTKKVIWFRPALSKDSPLRAARAVKAWLGTLQPGRDRGNDWALLRLDQPYGESYSWLDLAPLWENQPFSARSASLVGYATDFKDAGVPVIHRNCLITSFDSRGSYFRHDCHMNAGSSGAPLLRFGPGRPQIYAINAAHIDPKAVSHLPQFTSELANIAVGSTRYIDVLEALRQDRPLPSFIDVHTIDLAPPGGQVAAGPLQIPANPSLQ